MSQYAYAKKIQSLGYNVKIDNSTFETYDTFNYELDKFNIDLKISSQKENDIFKTKKILIKILNFFFKKKFSYRILNKLHIDIYNNNVIKEKNFLFDKSLLNIPDNRYLIGDFKSEKYFKDIRSILLNNFTLKNKSSIYFRKMKEKIKSKKSTCFIHVRRGDFVNKKNVREIHGFFNKEYYLKAAEFLRSKIKDVHFFIFSNDIPWCKDNIDLKNQTFMDNNDRYSPNEDIMLMSMCQNGIIDHSAFCWWGAWLIQSPNAIIVSPNRWFSDRSLQKESRDIYCSGWVKLS